MKDTLALLKELLRAFFESKDDEAITSLVSEELYACGFANDAVVDGMEDVKDYLRNAEHQKYKQYRLEFFDEKELPGGAAELGFTLAYRTTVVHYRVTATSVDTAGGRKLATLHFSIISPGHRTTLLQDIHDLHRLSMRQQLLDESVAGGMMGGYTEPGFPFYFINKRMLSYLGYASEQEFVVAIGGLIENCMYPEDREMVDAAVDRQIAALGEYTVDYRMLKKDGSYIWVHDVGRLIKADDGRDAIASVCFDITKERALQEQLQQSNRELRDLMHNLASGICVTEYDRARNAKILYLSDTFLEMCEADRETVIQRYEQEPLYGIYEDDLKAFTACYLSVLERGGTAQVNYRYRTFKNNLIYIQAHLSAIKHEDGTTTHYFTCADITEIMAVKAHLEDANQRMEQVFANMPGGMAVYHWTGTMLKPVAVSKGFSELHGQDAFELLNSQDDLNFDQVHPDDLVMLQRFITESVKTPNHRRMIQYRIWNCKKNQYVWLQNSCIGILQEDETQMIYSIYVDVTNEVEMRRKALSSEKMLDSACRVAQLWIFEVDIPKHTAYPSEYLQDVYHLPPVMADFPNSLLAMKLVHPAFEEQFRAMIRDLPKGNNDRDYELQMVSAEGGYSWMRYRWAIREYRDGAPAIAVGYAQAIDQEKQQQARIDMERKKMLSGDKFLTAYSIMNLSTMKIVECRDYQWTTGIAVDDTLDKALAKAAKAIYLPEDAVRFRGNHRAEHILDQYRRGVSNWENDYRFVTADGTMYWQRNVCNVLKDPATGSLFLYDYLYDVMAEKILEEFVEGAAKSEYEIIGVLAMDSCRLYEINFDEGAPHVITKDYEALRTQYVQAHVIPEDREAVLGRNTIAHIRQQLSEHPEGYFFEHRTYRQDGAVAFMEVCFYKLRNSDNICFCNVRDVTETIRRENEKNEELSRALNAAEAATRAKTDFLARMSHDMRTPMNAIIGLTALTLDDAKDPAAVRENMTKMRASSDFLLGLVNDILDMAKIEDGSVVLKAEPYSYRDFVHNIRTMFQPQCDAKGIRFVLREPKINPVVLVDRMRLNQIFFNVLSNAVKYTHSGGTITYAVEDLHREGKYLCGTHVIHDTGIGMSEEYQKHLFEPFMQENSDVTPELQGSGLGLSITKQLVSLMDGSLRIDSKKGVGTTVRIGVRFECLDPDAKEAKREPSDPTDESILAGKRVLLVEDHPLNAQIARKLLERREMLVTHA